MYQKCKFILVQAQSCLYHSSEISDPQVPHKICLPKNLSKFEFLFVNGAFEAENNFISADIGFIGPNHCKDIWWCADGRQVSRISAEETESLAIKEVLQVALSKKCSHVVIFSDSNNWVQILEDKDHRLDWRLKQDAELMSLMYGDFDFCKCLHAHRQPNQVAHDIACLVVSRTPFVIYFNIYSNLCSLSPDELVCYSLSLVDRAGLLWSEWSRHLSKAQLHISDFKLDPEQTEV